MGLPPGRVTQVLAVIGLYIIVNSAMELWPLFSDLRTPLVALIGVQLLSLAASLRFPVLYILFSASIIPGILLPVLYGGRLPQPLLASWIAFTILGEYRSISRRWGVSGGSGLGMGGVASILGFLALLAVSGSTLYLLYYGVLGSLEGLLSRIGGDVRLFYGILSLTSLFTIALALAVVYVYYRLVLLVSWLLSYLQPGGARLAAREYELEAGSERENLLGMKGVQYRGLYESFNIVLSLVFLPIFAPATEWLASQIGGGGLRARILASGLVYAVIWLLLRPSARLVVEPGPLGSRRGARRSTILAVIASLSVILPLLALTWTSPGLLPVVKSAITGRPYYDSDPLSPYLDSGALADRYESLVEVLDELLSLAVDFFWGG